MDYPNELIPTANGVTSYVFPEAQPLGDEPTDEEVATHAAHIAAGESFTMAQTRPSPVDKIVYAFDALKGQIEALDAEGLAVLASCAEQIVINGFHSKGAEALPVRDAAKLALG